MEIYQLFQYIILCGVGYAGLSTVLVLAQSCLSGAMEVKFLFAAMKERSLMVKTAAVLIPMVLAATYILASTIGFAAFLAGAWEEYNYLLLATLTLNPPCISQMMICVGLFVGLTILYTIRYPMKPLAWLATFGVETLAAVTLLVLYGGLFLPSFPFTVLDLCIWDVSALRWPIYGLFTIVFKDFVLLVSLVLGTLLRERRPRADLGAEDAWDWRVRYERQVQRYLTRDYLALGVSLLAFGLATGTFFLAVVLWEGSGSLSSREIGGLVFLIGFILLTYFGFGGVGALLIYRRLRPETAKIYRQLLSLGEENTVLRLFYQEIVDGTPRTEKLGFNVSRITSEHFQLSKAGLKTTVSRIAPLDS